MGDDYAWLRPLKPAAELLAAKDDWGPLYDTEALRRGAAVAAGAVDASTVLLLSNRCNARQ